MKFDFLKRYYCSWYSSWYSNGLNLMKTCKILINLELATPLATLVLNISVISVVEPGQDSWCPRGIFVFLSCPLSSCSRSGTKSTSLSLFLFRSLSLSFSFVDQFSFCRVGASSQTCRVSFLWPVKESAKPSQAEPGQAKTAPLESLCYRESSEAERTDVRRRNFLPSRCSSLPLASLSPADVACPAL